ncbi:MAG: sulfite exporter TauE/SafE family protein, partial [Rhodospirillales bacterium]|nr:sulfite exporter TauE/SafE family protein [Rhodospirillales bacterium]
MASLFLTGLVGSLSHCAGMCGPFVLSQVAARLESRPASRMREWHRLTG